MDKKYILITGVTGFLGSHIAEKLIHNHNIIGLKRNNSDLWRCNEFYDKIIWIDIDDEKKYIRELNNYFIETIIHAAWIGVESNERNNWGLQLKNTKFLLEILELTKIQTFKKFIFLGTQAEYGKINGVVNEFQDCQPLTAYGCVKLNCLEILKTFSIQNNINWIWLRIFSLFGQKEDESWLIPSLVKTIRTKSQMDLTLGEQKYSYLYIKDFAFIIERIVGLQIKSGIYNVSSDEAKTIRYFVQEIRDRINTDFHLNFGALEYRENQSMHIQGSINKLKGQIGNIQFTDFSTAIDDTIKYYINTTRI